MLEFLRVEIISYSPATDTIGDSVFYVEADGGSYISDYLNTYSYGAGRLTLNSPVVNYGYYDDSACLVDSDGDVSNFWDVVNSYGSKIYTNLY